MFKDFKKVMQEQFQEMLVDEHLFIVDLDKDVLWETYLNSFPEGTNNLFRERREYDCNCCKQFIRACGNMVSIRDNKLVSIWDKSIDGKYGVVSKALSKFVKSHPIKNLFFSDVKKVGTDFNVQLLENGETLRWEHFYLEVPNKFVNSDPGRILSEARSLKEVFKRSLEEISVDAIETVLELIDQNSLYRGQENRNIVDLFLDFKKEYQDIKPSQKDNYCWLNSVEIGPVAKIRNTAIGTLLVNISEGKTLDSAVKSFEVKVAPMNYKRPTALITKSMIDNAQKKVEELGIQDSLSRRYANISDITINNILFADRTAKKEMNVFDELKKTAKTKEKNFDKIEEVNIEDFINNILPKASKIEVQPENCHMNNFVSLIAPQNKDAKKIFKWNNNFSWAYNGDVTDSVKEKVKSAGGNVDGYMRFSISWFNFDDLDAHCIEPHRNEIYYGSKRSSTSGFLDIDMNAGGRSTREAVENIVWTDKRLMKDGVYKFYVNNFQQRENVDFGFDAEIEFNGTIYTFHYDKKVSNRENVLVAEIKLNKAKDEIEFINSLPSSKASKEVWNVSTNQFLNAKVIMNSPNHWDNESTGNKHYFFMIDDCKNQNEARGFFNEFLKEELNEHRKVFEVLGSKMKVQKSDDQLSGLGFSSTQRNHLICKVHGSFTRMIKIIF